MKRMKMVRIKNLMTVVSLMVFWFDLLMGVSVFEDEKSQILREEDKRGTASETKNELSPTEDLGTKSKRGLTSLLGNKRQFGLDLQSSSYGAYESGRYGPSGYPLSASGPYGDDRRPPFIDDNIRYPHSGGGYIGERPTAYGPGYAPPPRHPLDYEDHYPTHGGDSFGGVQMSTIKKILIPLAGLAILGVAAAASHNPVLLPLGTLNGRRKRSLLPSDVYPRNPIVRPLIANVKR